MLVKMTSDDIHQDCPFHRDLSHPNDQNGEKIVARVPNRELAHPHTRRWPISLLLEVLDDWIARSEVCVFAEIGCPEELVDPENDQR